MMEKEYLRRTVDEELNAILESSGAVLIEGPKWCGKTRTAQERAASAIYLQDIDKQSYYQHMLDTKPSALLEGETPRLIDEWQVAPVLWNGVRFLVDQRCKAGQFILTGSVVQAPDKKLHTGTGRIARLLMRPMTLFESNESDGSVSLRSLFNGDDVGGVSPLTVEGLAFALVRGGWPASMGEERVPALRHAREYVKAVRNTDISSVDGVERDPDCVDRLMRSLARNVSTTAKLTTIRDDMAAGDPEAAPSMVTVRSYMNALRRLFVIEDQPAWLFSKRSKTAARTSPKRHFVDPSIATAALQMSPEGLLNDFNTFGLLFESLCVRDLRAYAQANDGYVYHYRDKNGLEVDAVVELLDGRWGAVEVKMSERGIDEAAANLARFREKVDTGRMGQPSFLMVVTATEHAYRRRDGVLVVPIGCLRE